MLPDANKPILIDLFSGCGGFSLGAEMAGWDSIFAIDIDPTLQSAYKRNFPRTKVVQGNVAELDATAWSMFIGNQRPDCIIGGPPCQGFSRMGKRNICDPRNTLLSQFTKQVALLRPKTFVMENVQGLLDEQYREILNCALEVIPSEYTVLEPTIVNALNFGAATNRKRVVIIGYLSEYTDPISQNTILPHTPQKLTSVKDAISDLPSPVQENKSNGIEGFTWAPYDSKRHQLPEYAKAMRASPATSIGWKQAVEMQQAGYVSGSHSTRHTTKVANRYAATPPGQADSISKSYRLTWDGQCPTLRAGTGSDRGAFQAVRPLHPAEGRVITVREAARLQGFPDWFTFHRTKWHSFRMIGNSVSPLVSLGIMSAIKNKTFKSLAA
ncbi:DNA cytosine methyltransferase [Pseudodesulfovibrio karagichevae]|uniref:Cytosine-specific methyltransferase n=1 Tax=Pseudodesulfovibrio karagichevae TaxID=3239305 RepID=A0ABV4JZ52_9BACT